MKEISMNDLAEMIQKGTLEGKVLFTGQVTGAFIHQKGIKTKEWQGDFYEGRGDFYMYKDKTTEGEKAKYIISMSGRGRRGERVNYSNLTFGVASKVDVEEDETLKAHGKVIKFRTDLAPKAWVLIHPDEGSIIY